MQSSDWFLSSICCIILKKNELSNGLFYLCASDEQEAICCLSKKFFFLSSIDIAMSILCRAPASTLNPSWLFIALHLFSVNFYPCFCFKTWREDCGRVMLEIMHGRYDLIIQESHYMGHRRLILWNKKYRAIKTVPTMKTCFRNWNHQKHTPVSLCVPNESEIRMLSEMRLQ